MKCNKCSTPIISGDKKCRFCGADVFNGPEIIDIEPEIIGVEEIIDIEEVKGKNIVEKNEIDVSEELEKTIRLKKIDIEEFTGRIETKEVQEIKEKFQESKEKISLDNKIKKENNEKNYSNQYVTVGVLSLLVMIFGISTGYLFVNRNVLKKVDSKKISTNLTTAFFDTYELLVPDNWKTTENKEVPVFFDESYEWAASMEVIENADYSKLEEKKEQISTSYNKNGYIFTSNYTKKINDKEFFIYKGKYDAYIVYLIINKIDDAKVVVTDLKFKNEVNKEILDTVLNSISEIKNNDLSELYEINFNFSKTGQIVKEKIVISGEGIKQ